MDNPNSPAADSGTTGPFVHNVPTCNPAPDAGGQLPKEHLTHEEAWKEAIRRYATPESRTGPIHAGFERAARRVSQGPVPDARRVNIDPGILVTTVQLAVKRVRRLQPAFTQALPVFDTQTLDMLDDAQQAVVFVEGLYRAAVQMPDGLAALADAAGKMRDVMTHEASLLVAYGLVPAAALQGLRADVGYRTLALDLETLVHVFNKAWEKRGGRGFLTDADLAKAERLANDLLNAVTDRQLEAQLAQAATVERTRYFIDLVERYDELRRAVNYVRYHEGDADKVAPSPYAARLRARQEDTEEPATPEKPTPATDPAGPGTKPAMDGTQPQNPEDINPFAG